MKGGLLRIAGGDEAVTARLRDAEAEKLDVEPGRPLWIGWPAAASRVLAG